MAVLSPLPILTQFDTDGAPLVGGQLFTYLANSSTKTPTYTTQAGNVANTNPVVLDAYGQCQVWVDPAISYKFVMAPADDTDPPTSPIWTVNDITIGTGVSSIGGATGAITLGAGLAINGQVLSATIYRNYIAGLTLSTAGGSSTFSVAVGMAVDNNDAAIMQLVASLNKTTSAFAAGTGNGSLDVGSIANATWYHAYLIENPTTGAVDILTSLIGNNGTPTLPSGYTLYRRIGSMLTDGSAHWTAFTQDGDTFTWVTPVSGGTNIAVGTALQTVTLAVPTNVQPMASGAVRCTTGTAGTNYFGVWNPLQTGALTAFAGPALTAWLVSGGTGAGVFNARANVNGQVSVAAAQASTLYDITTYGWVDRRGRDA